MSEPDWYIPQPNSPFQVYDADTIRDIQRTLSCPETGEMDATTVNHIKGLQFAMSIPATGRVDKGTAIAIQRLRDRYAVQVGSPEEVPLREASRGGEEVRQALGEAGLGPAIQDNSTHQGE